MEYFNSSVTIRLPKAEKEKLAFDAEIAGISVSELIRRRYFGRPIITRGDKILIRELRRQGGLLKNGFSALREANASRELIKLHEDVLKKIEALLETISHDSQKS